MDLFEIGAALRAARTSGPKKLSQQDVATATGIGRATLSRIENGTIEEIGIRKIMRLCEFLGVTLAITPEDMPPTLDDLVKEHQVLRTQRRA